MPQHCTVALVGMQSFNIQEPPQARQTLKRHVFYGITYGELRRVTFFWLSETIFVSAVLNTKSRSRQP